MGVKNKNKVFSGFFLGLSITLVIVGAVFISTDVLAITVDPNIGSTLDLGTADLLDTVINIIQWALGLLGLIAVVMILYGGFLWMTANGNEDRIAKAKRVLKQAIIGLIIVLLSWAIVLLVFHFINDTTSPYPAHCSNGVQDEDEEDVDCGGADCAPCSTHNTLPTDEFFWDDTAFSYESGNSGPVNRCSRVQPHFNHRIDGDTFTAFFRNDNTGELYINGYIPSELMEMATNNNSITIKHDDELFPADTDMTVWIPQDVEDLDAETLSYVAGGAFQGSHPLTGDNDFYWNFHVGTEVDLVNPYITGTFPYSPPESGYPSRNVSMSPVMQFNFNEAIDISTIDDGTGIPDSTNFVLEQLSDASVCVGGVNDGDYCTINDDCDSNVCTTTLLTTCQGGLDNGQECAVNADCDSNVCSSTVDNSNFEVVATSDGFDIRLDNGYIFQAFGWYRVSVSGIEDLCGNTMEDTNIFEFQTNDLQPGISGRYPTGPDACGGDRIYVGFNTTMFYDEVIMEVREGDPANAPIYVGTMAAWSLGLVPPGVFDTPGSNGSTFRVMDTNDYNEFRGYELILPDDLTIGSTYYITIDTDKVIDQDGNDLEDSWNFTVAAPEVCRCDPVITYISPDNGQQAQCVTVGGYCFDGAGKATISGIDFSDADGDPSGVSAELGGSGANYYTTVVPYDEPPPTPPTHFEYGGDINPVPQIEIDYTAFDPALGTASSNNFAVRYYIDQPDTSTGPCLWTLNPTEGPIDSNIDLRGDRFIPDPEPTGVRQITFTNGATLIQENTSIWDNDFIRSVVNHTIPAPPATPPYSNLLPGATYDVGVTTDGGDSNTIEYLVSPIPSGQSAVLNPIPMCTAACVNADVSATLTNDVDTGTIDFDDGSGTGSVILVQCADDICNNMPPGNEIDISGSTFTVNGSETDLAIDHANFDVNTAYRMILTTDIKNTTGTSGGTVITNFDYNNDGTNDSFSWWFRTKDDPEECTINEVRLTPMIHSMASVQSYMYQADAYGSPDSCNPGGQQLNSQVATWDWSSTDTGVATATDSGDRESLVAGVAAGSCQIDIDITDVDGDNFNDYGDLTVTDCETDAHCSNNCPVPGNGSICVDNICTPWIGEIDPDEGPAGTTTTINGCYFGNYVDGTSQVEFGSGNFGTFECGPNSWTNSQIIVKTPGLTAGSSYTVGVITADNYTNRVAVAPQVAGSGQEDIDFTTTLLCGHCQTTYESCNDNSDCPVSGNCVTGLPSAEGMPGVCYVEPNTQLAGNLVDYDGYGFINGVTYAYFSQYLNNAVAVANGTVVSSDSFDDVTVPATAFTGKTRVSVDNCVSNPVDFYLACDEDSDCASNCCQGGRCSENPGDCSTNTPGDLCQIPANDPYCQGGQIISSSSDYRCIDEVGHGWQQPPIGALYPPDPAGVAIPNNNDCRICCFNGMSNSGGLDCNVSADTECTGSERGLYCGCNYANPAIGDQECDPANPGAVLACGSDTCCHQRVNVVSSTPDDGDTNICRNASVSVVFENGNIDFGSVDSSSVKLLDAGTNAELTANYFPMPGPIGFYINPAELFDVNQNIRVVIMGGVDGVLSEHGIAVQELMSSADSELNYDYDGDSVNDSYSFTFTVGNEVCDIDDIFIIIVSNLFLLNPIPPQDLFTCAADTGCVDDHNPHQVGNQHILYAQAMDRTGQYLYGGIDYDFEKISDPYNIINVDDLDYQSKWITANNENGRAVVRVEASSTSPQYTSTAVKDVSYRNMLCKNPWPEAGNAPLIDDDFNFALWYCLDSGLEELEQVSDIGITGPDYPTPAETGDGVNQEIKRYFIEWPGAEDLSDSIGIQVYENEGGLSAKDWYYKQFGSAAPAPQEITIDGYDAVRDGRSVYVAAWNVADSNGSGSIDAGDDVFPNIYILSHSDSADTRIVDIFNALLANWEFNTNINDPNDKLKMQRDFQRVGDLNTIFDALLDYYDENGSYPLLPGGTFIQKMSTSVWPSWDDTLGQALGIDMPRDPFNEIATCNYDNAECWNETTQYYQCQETDDNYIYQYFANNEDNMDLFAHLEILSVNGGSPETFSWGPSGFVDPCDTVDNADCDCFNYTKDTAGTSSDRIGPVINNITNVDTGDTANPNGTLPIDGTQTISVGVTDADSAVAKVEFWLDDTFRSRDEDATGSGWTWVMEGTSYGNGDHNLEIWAYDNYGNLSKEQFVINVNNGSVNTPPYLSFENLRDGDVVSGQFDISIYRLDDGGFSAGPILEIFDVDDLQNSLLSRSLAPGNGLISTTWDTTNGDFPNGLYTLRLSATDNTNLETIEDITVNVQNFDVTPPAITINNIDGACSEGGSCASGPTPCNRNDVCNDGTVCTDFPVCNQNTGCSSSTAICYREGDETLLSFEIIDDNNVSNVVVYVDGQSIGRPVNTSDNTWQMYWNTFNFPNGERTITVSATDQYNNESSESITVPVDNAANDIEPPTLSFVPPTPNWGTAVDNTVQVAANADDNRGVVQVEFFVDYRRAVVDTSGTDGWGFSFDTIPMSAGLHSFQAFSVDSAGNRSITQEIQVIVRGNGGPIITEPSVYPTTGNIGTMRCFDATVEDADGIQYVNAVIQDENEVPVPGAVINMSDNGSGLYQGSWQVQGVDPEQVYFVDIVAEDNLGNVSRFNNIPGDSSRVCGSLPSGGTPVMQVPLSATVNIGPVSTVTLNASNGPQMFYIEETQRPPWVDLTANNTGVLNINPPGGSESSTPYSFEVWAENSNGTGDHATFLLTVNLPETTNCGDRCEMMGGISGWCTDPANCSHGDECSLGNPGNVCDSGDICCCLNKTGLCP